MLVIARNVGEMTYLVLPDGKQVAIRVSNIDRKGTRVKLAFDCDRSIAIVRDNAIRGARQNTQPNGARLVPALPTDSDCETDA